MTEQTKRSKSNSSSKQPRFQPVDSNKFYGSVFGWVMSAVGKEPPYSSDSRERDQWLSEFWMKEPHLAGVINSVVAIDKNRGWSIIGGRNQVLNYTRVLHNYGVAPSLFGWRAGISSASLSYYTADIGTIIELGRDGKGGPLRGLFHVDPARCMLTGDTGKPIKYYPSAGGGKMQEWEQDDFMRICSLASTSEKMRGLGLSALSRCLELAKIMIAVYEHDNETLGVRAPKGILLLKGITETMWQQSLEARKAELQNMETKYYEGVQVLATEGAGDIDAKLIGLSSLPANFDMKTFTQLLIYGYALCFGYDPREFYPVSGGQLGTATETETQHRKATGKGGMDFILSYQEQLQLELPETIQFQFDQRDEEGEILEASVQAAKLGVVKGMYEGNNVQQGMITLDEARSKLVEANLIPTEWTNSDEPEESTDVELSRQFLENEHVQRAIYTFPDEPIVRYLYPSKKLQIVLQRAGDAIPDRSVVDMHVREKPTPENKVLYADPKGKFQITQADVDRAVLNARKRVGAEYANLLTAEVINKKAVPDDGNNPA